MKERENYFDKNQGIAKSVRTERVKDLCSSEEKEKGVRT